MPSEPWLRKRLLAEVLHYFDADGHLTFTECRNVGTTASTLGLKSSRIRSTRVVESGLSRLTYDYIDGMTTEVDGLATWAQLSTVSASLEREGGSIRALVLRAENPPEVVLGGDLEVVLDECSGTGLAPKATSSLSATW